MHAFLIIGNDKQTRDSAVQKKLDEKGILEVIKIVPEKGKHLIAKIRDLIRTLSYSPQNPESGRAVVLEEAHLLTQEAANSLLKTLENPVGNTIIFLTAPNEDLLPETIVSRTQIIRSENLIQFAQSDTFLNNFFEDGLGAKFKHSDKIKNREEAIEFCDQLILFLRSKLLENLEKNIAKKIFKFLETAIQTKKDLEANVNIKIALGDLFLKTV